MMTPSNGNIIGVTGPVRGIHRIPVNSPHKDQWRRALMFSLMCAWINGWVNNRDWWFETTSCSLWCHYNVKLIGPCLRNGKVLLAIIFAQGFFALCFNYYIHIHFKVSQWTNVICLRIWYSIVLRALGQSSDCLNKMKHILPKDGI